MADVDDNYIDSHELFQGPPTIYEPRRVVTKKNFGENGVFEVDQDAYVFPGSSQNAWFDLAIDNDEVRQLVLLAHQSGKPIMQKVWIEVIPQSSPYKHNPKRKTQTGKVRKQAKQ
jgi:hypothetical protein